MRKFFVTSMNESIWRALSVDIDLIISLLEDESELPDCHNLNRVFFKMDDVFWQDDPLAPTKKQLEDILEVISETDENARILIHCRAGISRSTAVCMAALMQEHDDTAVIFEEMKKIRPICAPNELILQHADEIFGTGIELRKIGDDLSESMIIKR